MKTNWILGCLVLFGAITLLIVIPVGWTFLSDFGILPTDRKNPQTVADNFAGAMESRNSRRARLLAVPELSDRIEIWTSKVASSRNSSGVCLIGGGGTNLLDDLFEWSVSYSCYEGYSFFIDGVHVKQIGLDWWIVDWQTACEQNAGVKTCE